MKHIFKQWCKCKAPTCVYLNWEYKACLKHGIVRRKHKEDQNA